LQNKTAQQDGREGRQGEGTATNAELEIEMQVELH
jgi:hypothetical protein